MSCKTPCTPKQFLSDVDDKAKEIVDGLGSIVLPDIVNEAIDSAVKQKKDSMIAEGKSKIVATIDWDHWTYATRDHFFMIDRDENGKWWIKSQFNFWQDPQRWAKLSTAEKLAEAAGEAELLGHLLDRARSDDIERFLEF